MALFAHYLATCVFGLAANGTSIYVLSASSQDPVTDELGDVFKAFTINNPAKHPRMSSRFTLLIATNPLLAAIILLASLSTVIPMEYRNARERCRKSPETGVRYLRRWQMKDAGGKWRFRLGFPAKSVISSHCYWVGGGPNTLILLIFFFGNPSFGNPDGVFVHMDLNSLTNQM